MAYGAPDWYILGLYPLQFLQLEDTPGEYTDKAALGVKVDAAEENLEFTDMAPDAHKDRHKSGGADEIDITGLTPKLHEATHRSGGTDVLLHSNLNPQTSDHHVKFSAANARAAIGDIFGADGKADGNINLDSHSIISGSSLIGPVSDDTYNGMMYNVYWDDPAWRFIADGYATFFYLYNDGSIRMFTSTISGLADGAITWKATFMIDADGNLTLVATYDGISLSKPIMVAPAAFQPRYDTYDYDVTYVALHNRTSLTVQGYVAPVYLPHGKTVSELKLYGFRDDGSAAMYLALIRSNMAGGNVTIADVSADWTNDYGSHEDQSITSGLINNDTYNYALYLELNPNNNVNDVQFTGAKISFA